MKMGAGPLLLFITCAVQHMLLCSVKLSHGPLMLMLMLTLDRSDQRRLKTDVWTLFCLLK